MCVCVYSSKIKDYGPQKESNVWFASLNNVKHSLDVVFKTQILRHLQDVICCWDFWLATTRKIIIKFNRNTKYTQF